MGEFRMGWRHLLAASLGLALGGAMNHYLTSLFGPALVAEFGWEKSQFALIGSIGLVSMFLVPVAGRFTDRYGARVAASIGFVAVPLSFFAFSLMTGDIYQFFAISIFQQVFGILTTTLVFARVIVERFDMARGMALSVLMTGPPLIGALSVPVVGEVIDSEGWRAGYRMLAAISAAGGIATLALMGPGQRKVAESGKPAPRMTWAELKALSRHPAFLLLIGGMFFCNVPQVIVSSQLKLVLMESGAAARVATWIVSLYAAGVVVGRFITGLALDRVPAHIVSIFALGLPALGYLTLASPLQGTGFLAGSVLLIGLAQGAEGDVGAYLTSRKFSLRHYSLVYSFLITSMGLASALGSVFLSASLHRTDSFNLFLLVSAVATLFGAACFFLTGRFGRTDDADPAPIFSGENA